MVILQSRGPAAPRTRHGDAREATPQRVGRSIRHALAAAEEKEWPAMSDLRGQPLGHVYARYPCGRTAPEPAAPQARGHRQPNPVSSR